MRRGFALWLVFVARVAGASDGPVARYNDPLPARPRSSLASQVGDLARRVAKGNGRSALEVDPRLEAALAALSPFVADSGPPPNDLVQDALHLYGIVEPSPHLVVVTLADGGEASLFAELEARLPAVLAQGRYRRMGIAVEGAPEKRRILIGFQESFVELLPVPRRLPPSGSAALDGRLLAPYAKPELFVTSSDGTVARRDLGLADDGRFHATFHCGASSGRYQIEIAGEDRFGLAVLANFPVFCGVAPPVALGPVAAAPDRPFRDEADAEAQVFAAVNQDRARAGLSRLILDGKLSEVARAHSIDMRDHGFFGHVSPSTGNADDRLKRSGITVPLVLENISRAYSPVEAERGLMDSPGHRGNILNPQAERIGVGVALAAAQPASGIRDLFVTQLLVRRATPFHADRAPEEMRVRIGALRRDAGLGPLGDDTELDAVAREVAEGLAKNTLPADKPGAPVERALTRLGHYRSLRTVVARAAEVSQLGAGKALLDRDATHAGVAAVAGPSDAEGRGLFLVVVLGARR